MKLEQRKKLEVRSRILWTSTDPTHDPTCSGTVVEKNDTSVKIKWDDGSYCIAGFDEAAQETFWSKCSLDDSPTKFLTVLNVGNRDLYAVARIDTEIQTVVIVDVYGDFDEAESHGIAIVDSEHLQFIPSFNHKGH